MERMKRGIIGSFEWLECRESIIRHILVFGIKKNKWRKRENMSAIGRSFNGKLMAINGGEKTVPNGANERMALSDHLNC